MGYLGEYRTESTEDTAAGEDMEGEGEGTDSGSGSEMDSEVVVPNHLMLPPPPQKKRTEKVGVHEVES